MFKIAPGSIGTLRLTSDQRIYIRLTNQLPGVVQVDDRDQPQLLDTGNLVWSDEEGMFETGIRFTNLEDYQRLILRKYIK